MILPIACGFLLGAGVQWLQILLTAWMVKNRARKPIVLATIVKLLAWAGLLAGMLLWDRTALYASLAGGAVCLVGYGIVKYASMNKGE